VTRKSESYEMKGLLCSIYHKKIFGRSLRLVALEILDHLFAIYPCVPILCRAIVISVPSAAGRRLEAALFAV
jgi:hypothetical protein